MIIRNLQKKDAVKVADLIKQLTPNIIEPVQLVKRIGKLPQQKNSQFFVAQLHGSVVGFGGLAWYVIPSKGLIAWAEELVVDSQYRGQGIGAALMKKILHHAEQKNIRQVKLTSTKKGKALHEKLGFIVKDHEYLVKKV